jgi:pimeloyl-ACP methyl ester carboxylesterase
VRIAYAASGEGYPLLFVHGWASHLEFWPKMPGGENFVHSKLAQHYRYYRYDARGWGLSDRDVTDFSLSKKLLDVAAVVENAGLDRFAIIGASEGGPTAITYAAENPERVSHLVLLGTFAWSPPPATPEERELLKVRTPPLFGSFGRHASCRRATWK